MEFAQAVYIATARESVFDKMRGQFANRSPDVLFSDQRSGYRDGSRVG
jgi:hypothetical protein